MENRMQRGDKEIHPLLRRSFLFVRKSRTFRGNRPRNFPQLDLYTLPNLRVLFENEKIYNERYTKGLYENYPATPRRRLAGPLRIVT